MMQARWLPNLVVSAAPNSGVLMGWAESKVGIPSPVVSSPRAYTGSMERPTILKAVTILACAWTTAAMLGLAS